MLCHLQKQAEECAEKAKLPNKGLNVSKRRSEQKDPEESSSHGLQTQEGEMEADDMEYEGSHETTTSNSDDEDSNSPRGTVDGKGQEPSDNLNRVSVDSSQATVRLATSQSMICFLQFSRFHLRSIKKLEKASLCTRTPVRFADHYLPKKGSGYSIASPMRSGTQKG